MWVALRSNGVGSHVSLCPTHDPHVVLENASRVFGNPAVVVKGFMRDVLDLVCLLEGDRMCGLGSRGKRVEEDMAKVGPMKHILLSILPCLFNGGYIVYKVGYCHDHALMCNV